MALWTPANLTTAPKCWLQADALALSNGDPVVTWTDSSGSGANATVKGGFASPLFETNQLNSLPVVRFDTSNIMVAAPTVTTTYTVIGLAHNNTGLFQARIFSGDSGSSTNWLLGWWNTKQDVYYFGGGNLTGAAMTTNWLMYEATCDNATTLIYKDGSLLYTDVGGALAGIGSILSLNADGTTDVSNSEIAEVLVCNYVMSTTDRQLVEGYMAWKWGRQASLPGGHPYAGAAPTTGPGPLAGVNFLRKGDRRS